VEKAARYDLPEAEVDAHIADLRTQADNLAMLLERAEAELAQREAQVEFADTTEEWLRSLKDRVPELEGDSEEAFFARRYVVECLVASIEIKDKRKPGDDKVHVTYRFGSPEDRADELRTVFGNYNEFLKMKQKRDASLTVTR